MRRSELDSGAILQRTVLVILGALCALLTVESALRGAGHFYARWRLHEHSAPIRSGARRVLCVGDSFTFGVGAPKGFSYPEQLQGLLDGAAGAGEFQVINAGVPGSNSSQLLEDLGPALDVWRPEVLVVMTGWNDSVLADSNYWKAVGLEQLSWPRRAAFRAECYVASCRTYKLIETAWRGILTVLARPGPPSPAHRVPDEEMPLALAHLRLEQERDPAHFGRWLEVAILYHRLKKFPEARDAYQRAVQAEPGNAEARYGLARMLHFAGDYRGAKIQLAESLKGDPSNEVARQLMANYTSSIPGPTGLMPDEWHEPLLRYDLSRITLLARQCGAKVILETYPNPNPINPKLRRVFAWLAASLPIAVIDQSAYFGSLREPSRYYSGDQPDIASSHLNAAGYRLVAQNVLASLTAMKRTQSSTRLPGPRGS